MGIPVEVLPFRLWLLIEMEWIKEMKSRKRTVLTLTHHMGEEELKEKKENGSEQRNGRTKVV